MFKENDFWEEEEEVDDEENESWTEEDEKEEDDDKDYGSSRSEKFKAKFWDFVN